MQPAPAKAHERDVFRMPAAWYYRMIGNTILFTSSPPSHATHDRPRGPPQRTQYRRLPKAATPALIHLSWSANPWSFTNAGKLDGTSTHMMKFVLWPVVDRVPGTGAREACMVGRAS